MYRVMLVDDEPSVCKGLMKLIHWEECGFAVADIASNGQEAYEKHLAERFDLIITDIKMPVMDGISLLKKLYNTEYSCQIIILSTYGEFTYAQEAMQYGVDYYLLKPIEETVVEGFLSRIREKLDAHEKPMTRIPDSEQIEYQYRLSENGVIPEIKRFTSTHFAEPLTLSRLAVQFSFSKVYLGRLFKQKTGETYSEYLTKIRIQAACDMLDEGKTSIQEIPEKVGLNDVNYFYKLFKQAMGMTPNQYKLKGGS